MIELLFNSAAAQRVRFAVSPASEVLHAVRLAAAPGWHGALLPWSRPAQRRLATLGVSELVATLAPDGYVPDFLSPPPAGPHTTLDEELDRVRATSPTQVATELDLTFPDGRHPPGLPADPAAARDLLATQLRRCWDTLLAPIWHRLRDLLEADIAHRSRQYAEGGAARVLSALSPAVRCGPAAVTVDSRHRSRVILDARGLLLVPNVLGPPRPGVVVVPPWQPTLVYPARGAASLWEERPAGGPDPLAGVVGRTKARLLTALAADPAGAGTGAVARFLGLSPGTVSAHLQALRAAGLVTAHRTGRTVRYQCTALGYAFTRGAG